MTLVNCAKMLSSISLAILLIGSAPVHAIWPAPSSLSTGNSTLWLQDNVQVTYNGGIVRWSPSPYPFTPLGAVDTNEVVVGQQLSWTGYIPPCGPQNYTSKAVVTGGVQRALDAILNHNFVPWKLYPRHEVQTTEPSLSEEKTLIKSLAITQTGGDNSSTWKPLAGQVDESYTFALDGQGKATIQAVSAVGVLHALETFTQLFFKHSQDGSIYTTKAPITIKDSPKYPHRGVLLDTARDFYSVESIKRTIDAISWNKMNRLHIHVTDSQSWPLEIPSLPELAGNGSYGQGATYSASDVADIQTYAIQRGVEVIFEIDSPGHIGSVALSHPELITAWEAAPWTTYCAEPPCGQFRLNDSAVDDFLDKLMTDLLPRLSPYSAYFHTGGDEVNVQDYLLDPTVKSNDSDVINSLLQKFTDKNHARVRKAGLTPMVWEEIPLDFNVKLGSDVVVQTWLGASSVKNLTSQGQKVIDSDYNYYYLDCGRGQWLAFDNGEAFDTYYPFKSWCDPTKSWQLIYSHDPAANLTDEEAKLVLGGEVGIWSESIDETNLDSLLWPRGSAAGEILWSGHTVNGQNRSQVEAVPRLSEMRERMVARGVGASPVQMIYCTQGMNGTTCEYPV